MAPERTGARATPMTRPRPGRYGRRRLVTRAAIYVVLVAFLAIFLVPVFWVLGTALKSDADLYSNPFGWPTVMHWDNFYQAWTVGNFGQYLANSAIYCVAIVTGVIVCSCLAGYALALMPLPFRNKIFTLFLLGLMIPFQSIMIPLYYLLIDMHVLDTYGAFMLPGIALGLSFGIFLMRAFFRGLPLELPDAARIDGASEWAVFLRVMLPLTKPGLTTLIVFQFMATWNAFLLPLVFVQRDELRPVALGLMFFFGRFTSDRPLIAAAATMMMIPVIVLYLALQRQFISGITAGAVKS
jgi:raffinose/stachyose/melibiose transport system permease protein